MENTKKVRDLVKPQAVNQNYAGTTEQQNLVVPYCSSGYSTSSSGSSCKSGYSSNLWCTSNPNEGDEILF
ncbi:hypothetical protein LX64_00976 [Chitinophaga skermanii]|uniref:Uncharacterized protein n=1 Tax=Chitinophaga skermanii TaxID=331697 RepID=A0A327QWY3_9BACT|nr:hypothetical protein [Chitinophaga skermanii]RAJ08328.1 hypothetical protein LX64_00976 [Chitinophaga skermanii]